MVSTSNNSMLQTNPTTSSNQNASKISNLLQSLVKNINVPSVKQNKDREISKNIFSVLPERLEMLRANYPELAAIYETNPNDYGKTGCSKFDYIFSKTLL